jgi:hypothetical protein
MAYDTIMVFQDQFKKHILPDQIHILNVAFLVPDMRREFGGTGGNIAYNLRLLGESPALMATVGHDFDPYRARLGELGISDRYVKPVDGQFTGPGLHHHGPGRQPDHRIPPGRHVVRAPEPRRRRAGREARHRFPRRAAGA